MFKNIRLKINRSKIRRLKIKRIILQSKVHIMENIKKDAKSLDSNFILLLMKTKADLAVVEFKLDEALCLKQ